jgi:hypothetical protein
MAPASYAAAADETLTKAVAEGTVTEETLTKAVAEGTVTEETDAKKAAATAGSTCYEVRDEKPVEVPCSEVSDGLAGGAGCDIYVIATPSDIIVIVVCWY